MSPLVSFLHQLVTLAQILTYCLLAVSNSAQHQVQMSDAFFEGS